MITMVNLTKLGHQSTHYWYEILYKDPIVFCNISARLSRYFSNILAATAHSCHVIT